MELISMSSDQVVGEVMRIYRSLPARPGIEELESAKALIRSFDKEEEMKMERIGRMKRGKDVREELFKVLQEMQKTMIRFQIKEQKMEARKVLDLEDVHLVFDELIQRASCCLPGISPESTVTSDSSTFSSETTTPFSSSSNVTTTPHSRFYTEKDLPPKRASESSFSKDDSFLKKSKASFQVNGKRSVDFSPVDLHSSGESIAVTTEEKLSFLKLASIVEVTAKKGSEELILKGRLSDQVEWLPDSVGKLSSLILLNLSENRIAVLPETIGGLSSLKVLDLHGNKITELPDSIGSLLSLLNLDLGGNLLKSLPPAIGSLINLQEMDVSSNGISHLPDSIGSLVSLKKLNISTNDIEEIPHTIGKCTGLKELRADYNRIKALPEAVGRIATLEILTVRYNNIRKLPTTMASMSSLKELNASFNELESVPESLCLVTTIERLNISNNFADLSSLPRSIGNLEMLQELDMSNNQIRVLPDSFRLLTRLRVLNLEGNPLEQPPRDVILKGPQAIVEYMTNLVEKRDVKLEAVKQKSPWANFCLFSTSNKRKRTGIVG